MLEYIIKYKTRKEMLQIYEMKIDAFSLTNEIISKIFRHKSFIINSPLYSDEFFVERVSCFTCPVVDGFETGSVVVTSTDSFRVSNEKRVWFDWVNFNNFNEIYCILNKIKMQFSIEKLHGNIFIKDQSFLLSHEEGLLNYWDLKFGIIIANK